MALVVVTVVTDVVVVVVAVVVVVGPLTREYAILEGISQGE